METFSGLLYLAEICTEFVWICQNNYSLGDNVTLDGKLEAFQRRCPFHQLCYFYNMKIYAGKRSDRPFAVSSKPINVVKRLIGIRKESYSQQLVLKLRSGWIFEAAEGVVCRNAKKNKRQIPPEFVSSANRKEYSNKFGFNNEKILGSYVPKKWKTVNTNFNIS